MPSRGMLLLLAVGLVIVAVAWVLLARNPNASDQRSTAFGASPPAAQPAPVVTPTREAPASAPIHLPQP